MNLKDKIVGLALASLIALIGWNLHETWGLKTAVIQLQHGQIVLSKQIGEAKKGVSDNQQTITITTEDML